MNAIGKGSVACADRRELVLRDVYLETGGKGPVAGLGPLCKKLGWLKEAASVTVLYDYAEERGYGHKTGQARGSRLHWRVVPDEWQQALARGERPSGSQKAEQSAAEDAPSEPNPEPEESSGEDLGPRQRQEVRREESRVAGGSAVNRVLEREAEQLAEAAVAPYVAMLERALRLLPRRARLLLLTKMLRLVELAEVRDPN